MKKPSLLLALLLLSGNSASARTLRGTRTRRVNQDSLFIDGRKGKGEGNGGISDGGSYDSAADPSNTEVGGEKQKGETINDRPAVKTGKVPESVPKQGSKMSGNKSGTKTSKEKGTTPPDPDDDVETPATKEGKENPKGATAQSKPTDVSEDQAQETAMEGNNTKPGTKEGGTGKVVKAPSSTPVSAPEGNEPTAYTLVHMAQVAYVLSPFGLEFTLGNPMAAGVPTTVNFAEVEAATIAYLEEYMKITYGADKTINYESSEIEATSRRTGGNGGTPFIDFEANIAFTEDSPMTPTPAEIGQTISEAFQEPNLAAYTLNLSTRLSSGNPFVSTQKVTVYVPDSNGPEQSRVSGNTSEFSAAGIAAAVGTGFLTVLAGGFLFFKIRRENMDMNDKFRKGYSGGLTLAGETCDNSTLAATATLPNDDSHSLENTISNDDRSFLTSHTPEAAGIDQNVGVGNQAVIRRFEDPPEEGESKIVGLETSPIADDESSESVDDNEEESDGEETFQNEYVEEQTGTKPAAFTTLVNRTKAMVPVFIPAQMSNADIKNYFKLKYKCGSPRYESVDEAAIDAVEASPSDDQSLSLVLPALDHDSYKTQSNTTKEGSDVEGAKQQPYRDYEEEYMRAFDDESLASTSPSDEGERADDAISWSESVDPGSVYRFLANAQDENQEHQGLDEDIVPRLPSEQRTSMKGVTVSVDRNLDDVSLGMM